MTQLLANNQSIQSTATQMDAIKVVVVDDSKLIRRAVRGLLESEPDITVIGEAENGAQALDLVSRMKPDVITLDVNMPVMDGISTIKHLMIKAPLPTVMLSTLTKEGSKVTFDALRYGATDFMLKPSRLGSSDISAQQDEIVKRVKNAAKVSTGSIRFVRLPNPAKRMTQSEPSACQSVVAMGASEGGYGPLLNIIPALDPARPVAYIAVFYTVEPYLDAFAGYLGDFSGIRVVRAEDGMCLSGGTCYLLSGEEYVTLSRQQDNFALCIHPNPFPGRRGSVNMLMFSTAENFKHKAVGVVLSGISEDGSEGLKEIKRHGGRTFVQDPSTCLHREMPTSAIQSCKVEQIVSDTQIANQINASISI